MKRLKRQTLFGGKSYPLYIAIACAFFLTPTGLMTDLPMLIRIPLVLSPVLSLVISFFIIHSLSPEEKNLIAQLDYPLWQPVTPEIKARICAEQSGTQLSLSAMLVSSGVAGFMVMMVCLLPSKRRHETLVPPQVGVIIGLAAAFAMFFYLMISKGVGANWMEIDDSAMFLQIPIDHMYDVTHHGKRGRTWTTSYLVFYQPDGRYILHAPAGSGDCNTVTVVKYGKALTWFTEYVRRPEDYMQ